jgi:hypothetical protein
MNDGEFKERLDNPTNKRWLNLMLMIGGLSVSIGLVLYLLRPSIIALIGSLMIAFLIYFSMGWGPEYILKPRSVEITNDGLQLGFQYTEPVHYSWSDIVGVYVSRSKLSPNLKIPNESVLKVKGKISAIPITQEIAVRIRERYKERMGVYPMNLADRFVKRHRSI